MNDSGMLLSGDRGEVNTWRRKLKICPYSGLETPIFMKVTGDTRFKPNFFNSISKVPCGILGQTLDNVILLAGVMSRLAWMS